LFCFQVEEKPDSAIAIQPRETQLESRIAKFISLICDVSMMKQQMMEIGWLFDLSIKSKSKALVVLHWWFFHSELFTPVLYAFFVFLVYHNIS
jgi:hypothetical protein